MSGSDCTDGPTSASPFADADPRRLRILELLRRFGDAVEVLEHDWAHTTQLPRSDLAAINHLTRSDTPMGMGELSQRLSLSPGATTALVDRLEARGHVVRSPHPSDRRRISVDISDDARAMGHAFFGAMAVRVLDSLADFEDDELAVVERFLERLPSAVAPSLASAPPEGAPDPATSTRVRQERDDDGAGS